MKRILLLFLITISFSNLFAQNQMWVGESREFDVSSSVNGTTRNLNWSFNGGYISLSGSGFYRKVTVNQYFSGSATVTCTWQSQLYYNGPWTEQRRDFTITCQENPVSIYPTSLTLAPGETFYLTYDHKYDNQYTYAADAYFSSDGGGGVISVSRAGEVTALKEGKAYVNVYSKLSSAANAPYCLVTVKEVDPTSVSIRESLTLIEGESYTLTPTLYPAGATSSYTWDSEDTSIATVSSTGTIKAIKPGKTKIKVTTTKGGYTDYCELTVKAAPVPPVKVLLPEKISIYNGFSTVLTPVLEPEIAESTYTWSVDDSSIVTVTTAGKITAQKVGKTKVTVKTANGLSASCVVVVTKVPENIDSNELQKRITILNNLSQTTLKYVE